jgi:hypothetical protein
MVEDEEKKGMLPTFIYVYILTPREVVSRARAVRDSARVRRTVIPLLGVANSRWQHQSTQLQNSAPESMSSNPPSEAPDHISEFTETPGKTSTA